MKISNQEAINTPPCSHSFIRQKPKHFLIILEEAKAQTSKKFNQTKTNQITKWRAVC